VTFDYGKAAATSLRLLTNFGQAVTRTTYTDGTMNQATGVVAVSTATSSRIGALFDLASGTTTMRGTLVNAGDKELYLDAESAVAITDHYTIGGIEYTVLSFEEVKPAATAVLYMLHLRRA
jgi:hypothetical protein